MSISVPRSHLVRVKQLADQAAGKGQAGDGAGAAVALDDAFVAAELAKIEKQVQPMLIKEKAGVLSVGMYDDGPMLMALAGQTAGSTGMMVMLQSGWVRPVGLTMLAVLALGMIGMRVPVQWVRGLIFL